MEWDTYNLVHAFLHGTIMRILHTFHRHLGQKLLLCSTRRGNSGFSDWLLETAQAHQVDAIIVAGDILIPVRRPAMPENFGARNRFVVNLLGKWPSSGAGAGRYS